MTATKNIVSIIVIIGIVISITTDVSLNAGLKGLTYFGQSKNSNLSKCNNVHLWDYDIYYTDNSVIKFEEAFTEYAYYMSSIKNSKIDIDSSLILVILPVKNGEEVLKYNNYGSINTTFSLSYQFDKLGKKMYFSLGFFDEFPSDTISFWVSPTSRDNFSSDVKQDTITLIRKK